jgi:hypothetical protein
MTRDEPGGLDSEVIEQAQQARRPDLAGKQAARDGVRRILAGVGPKPARYRVDIDAEPAKNFLAM